ncbi:MAG: response regulator [Bacteroidetes bacterium]|nr:response regulator [Bacteroidota bacterium]
MNLNTVSKSKTPHIIICDDSMDHQFLLKKAIKLLDVKCEITAVYNGLQLMDFLLKRQAYKNVTNNSADLIFLDLNMPLLTGHGVLKEMNEVHGLTQIPVYVFSTSSDPEDKHKSLALGALDHFFKPTDFNDLKDIVKNVCEKHLAQ